MSVLLTGVTALSPIRPGKARWERLLQALVIIAAVWWIYMPVLHGGWIWEDDFYLAGNPLLHEPDRLGKAWFAPGSFIEYYPIEQSVQWLQWRLWHQDTLGYHVTNVVLHLISALLVWRLLSKFHLRYAWLGGLLFAVHPAMVESVAWITEFKNTLSLPLFLLAMCFYLDYEERRDGGDYFLALGLFLVAMLCKPTMVMFPVVILLYAWWKQGRIRWNDLLASAPFFMISMAQGLMTIWSGRWYAHLHHLPKDIVPLGGFFSHVAMTGLSISFYFSKAVLPVELSPIYPHWQVDPPSPLQFLPWPVLGGVLYGLWVKRQSWGRHVLLGLLFFLITLAPFVINLVGGYTTFTWVMDHFLYIPIIGLIGLAVAGLGQIAQLLSLSARPYGLGVVLVVMALLAWESHGYAGVFRNEEILWTYTIERNPSAWLAHNNLGKVLAENGRVAEAMEQYQLALVMDNPHLAEVHTNLGSVLMQAGRISEAMEQYRQAMRLNPEVAATHYNMGIAWADLGRDDEALESYHRALAIDPDYAEAHNNLGGVLFRMERWPEAMQQYEAALRINPDYAEARDNLGDVLAAMGRTSEAGEQFREALRLNPADALARASLARLATPPTKGSGK